MTNKRKATELIVLIYDDEQNSAQKIKEQLDGIAGIQIQLLDLANNEVETLERRRRDSRSGASIGNEDTAFDKADILIVDYDLTSADDKEQGGPAETGERVAYLARCYSKCGTIVALNQFNAATTFDLTLIGHISSYADLNISGDQIGNPSLWGGPRQGFAPWSWPNLMVAPALQRQREKLLLGRTNDPALAVLGLGEPRVSNSLNRNQLAWLSPGAVPSEATVDAIVRSGRIGLRPKDSPWPDGGIERVAAARLAKWLERLVLPGQNVVVDAPHLVSRFPSLATSENLDDTTNFISRGSNGLATTRLRPHAFKESPWLSRPAWLWPTLSEDKNIKEVGDPFTPTGTAMFFTEDSSVFRERDWCRAFAADVEPFSRRFVTRLAKGRESRLPLYSDPFGLRHVTYQPQLRFAL
jgi:hypothetical protein